VSLSTHVLDGVSGTPASGVRVRLYRADEGAPGGRRLLAEAETDRDGRIREAFGVPEAGVHTLVFATGAYFARRELAAFYPEVAISFTVADPAAHHHVPLLLSPFAYSTYRGS
jgi:5-hydroxyisourate hydrolase